MLIDCGSCHPPHRHSRRSGVALVVTLALLVLVTVGVVAFFARTTANQQITSGSSQGVATGTFADGATQEIISGLQKEMWDLSGTSQIKPAPSPAIFPIPPLPSSVTNRIQGVVPTRMVGPNVPAFPGNGNAPDPNAGYSQFANLVKQSYVGVATYDGTSGIDSSGGAGPGATGSMNASNVLTTAPAVNGRQHDGVYWNQPQLVSISSTSSTATSDLAALVPDWIYTTRAGDHPTTYASSQKPAGGNSLSPGTVVGRYAYNVYDIGGLLNANVAGYGAGAVTQPNYADKDTMIVPAYKGSVLMADLSALNLNGNLNVNGGNANIFSATNTVSLPKFRSPTAAWATDLPKLFASGQYAGWLQPFLATYDPASVSGYGAPGGSAYLKSNVFNSRQDLITWVNSQLGAGGTTAAWTLPYLTHFSYDTDAPSFAPNVKRPKSTGGVGGNDSSATNDALVNPAFTAVLDANGYPLVKRRFPLSALALLDNVYPGNVPVDLLDQTSSLSKQIKYDFGLVWDSAFNCWDYKDWEGNSGAIKVLPTATNHGANTVPNTRSPNFFELLKAAISAGSLGKQWGAGNFDGDPDNTLDSPRYRATNYQIIQIGANIISQSTTNYCPTAICFFGQGQAPFIYGVKDLPYLYRTRLLTMTVDTFTGNSMLDLQYGPTANSLLAAVLVQPELWNPHAPNLLAPTTKYPVAFRVVPKTPATATAIGLSVYSTHVGTPKWAETPDTTTGTVANGDYTSIGGPLCPPVLTYNDNPPDAYLQFSSVSPTTSPNILGSFREPCPLAAPDFPPGIGLTGFPETPTMAATDKVVWDKKPAYKIVSKVAANTQNTIPVRLGGGAGGSVSNNTAYGFLVGYCCAGPSKDLTVMNGPLGGPLNLQLQYSMDGTHFYTYDTIQSSFPAGAGGKTEIMPPSGAQQTWTGIRTDPRTHRWGLIWADIPYGKYVYGTGSYGAGQYDNLAGLTFAPGNSLASVNYGTQGNWFGSTQYNSLPKAPGWVGALNTLLSPYALQMGWTQVNQIGSAGYYQDPDGIVRGADGAYVNISTTASDATGLPMSMLAVSGNAQASATGISNYDSRPVVLNRPFQSVAELGYAFRDTPWKSLDFFTPESGDAALLDVFTVYGPDPYSYMNTLSTETGLVAGKVNLNTRQQPVLAALLKGASTTTVFPNPNGNNLSLTSLDGGQAAAVARALVQWTTKTGSSTTDVEGPLLNPAELVGKYTGVGGTGSSGFNGFSSTVSSLLTGTEPPIIKQQRECVMHALADVGTTRTWNLLIDLVAQDGQLTPNAQGLQSFVVNGERHVWVSVALDRVTGRVIKMQVESVRL